MSRNTQVLKEGYYIEVEAGTGKSLIMASNSKCGK